MGSADDVACVKLKVQTGLWLYLGQEGVCTCCCNDVCYCACSISHVRTASKAGEEVRAKGWVNQ